MITKGVKSLHKKMGKYKCCNFYYGKSEAELDFPA